MNVRVEVNFCDEEAVYVPQLLERVAVRALELSKKISVDAQKDILLSVAFVSPKEIRRINRDYRGKNQVTDVISIGDYSDQKDISCEQRSNIFLGEIILCYNYIMQNARESNSNVDRDFFVVYVHGILHLLGFSHGEKMFQLQEDVAEQFIQ
jgi:probable rRNA maturation factor